MTGKIKMVYEMANVTPMPTIQVIFLPILFEIGAAIKLPIIIPIEEIPTIKIEIESNCF